MGGRGGGVIIGCLQSSVKLWCLFNNGGEGGRGGGDYWVFTK